MIERHEEALDELRSLASEIRGRAEDSTYGFFHGGDPRNFSPDPECCTEDELKRHAEACEAWAAGKGNPNPAPHCAFMNQGVAPPGFGMGVNTYTDEDMVDWAERLWRCIARLEQGS